MPDTLVRTLVRTIAYECMTCTLVRTMPYDLVRTMPYDLARTLARAGAGTLECMMDTLVHTVLLQPLCAPCAHLVHRHNFCSRLVSKNPGFGKRTSQDRQKSTFAKQLHKLDWQHCADSR